MTTHTDHPASHAGGPRAAPGAGGARTTAARPRWLLPGLCVVIAAGVLVFAGALPLSTALYAGMFGGMILMHMGGHGGHGGHATSGSGHAAHGGSTPDTEDLSARSSGPKPAGSGFKGELDDRVATDLHGNETDDHDQHGSHGCH